MYKCIVGVLMIISMSLGTAKASELGHEGFVREYVDAVNGGDVERLKGLVHPKSLACISGENRDFYDEYFSNEVGKQIPQNYRISDFKPIGEDEPLLMSGMFTYPVRPSHWVQIDFERGPYDSESILRQVVKLGGDWFMVVPCPTEEAMEQFRRARLERERQEERARGLLGELRDPLLSELKGLLRQGKRVQAWKKYSAETGESLSMAKEVLSLIEIAGDN